MLGRAPLERGSITNRVPRPLLCTPVWAPCEDGALAQSHPPSTLASQRDPMPAVRQVCEEGVFASRTHWFLAGSRLRMWKVPIAHSEFPAGTIRLKNNH